MESEQETPQPTPILPAKLKRLTGDDFDKIDRLLEEVKPGDENDPLQQGSEKDGAVAKAFYDAIPAIRFLVDYYYERMVKGENEQIPGDVLYATRRSAETSALALGYRYFTTFQRQNPNLLQEAIKSYKSLRAALSKPLAEVTGEQLILLLQEYDSRKESTQ